MKLPKIDLKVFYQAGVILFIIIALANTFTLLNNWQHLLISQKISSLSSIIFNITLVGLFGYFYSTMPKPINIPEEEENKIEVFMESLKNEN